MANKGTAIAVTGFGVVLAISGIKGWKISATLRDLVAGTNPATDPSLADGTVASASSTTALPSAPTVAPRPTNPSGVPKGLPKIITGPPSSKQGPLLGPKPRKPIVAPPPTNSLMKARALQKLGHKFVVTSNG